MKMPLVLPLEERQADAYVNHHLRHSSLFGHGWERGLTLMICGYANYTGVHFATDASSSGLSPDEFKVSADKQTVTKAKDSTVAYIGCAPKFHDDVHSVRFRINYCKGTTIKIGIYK